MKTIYTLIIALFLITPFIVTAQNQPKFQGTSVEFVNKFEGKHKLTGSTKDVDINLTGQKLITVNIENERSENEFKTYSGKVKNENSFFNMRTLPNKKIEGRIVLKDTKQAFKVFSDEQHNVYTQEVSINEVICSDYIKQDTKSHALSTTHSLATVPSGILLYELQSYPQASAVILLDFDGQYVPAGSWGAAINALPGNFSPDGIYETWQKVSEDFRPFKLNITTSESVYQAAPSNKRMRVILTPTTTAAPGYGGVAFVGSFTWGNETPCWVFNEGSQSGGESVSHEVGHTLNLIHDGRNDGVTNEEYYFGTDNGWAPIMGVAGFAQDLVQWSKGEYNFATNHEDDIAIIAGTANGFGFRDDLVGNTISSASSLIVTSSGEVSTLNNYGVIENASDVDVFSFYTTGGIVNLSVVPFNAFTNLNVQLTVKDLSNNVIAVINDPGYNAIINLNFSPGTYYIFVKGIGEGDPATTGYSDYGSIGYYSIGGLIPLNIVSVSSVSVSPASTSTIVNGTQLFTATILPSNATNKNVTWSSSNNTIATVDNTGLVTGKGDGTAIITATTQDGNKTATGSITITSIRVTSVMVSPSSVSIAVNGTQQLDAIVLPFSATNQKVTWSSSNNAIATVSNTGLVTGKAIGPVGITATTQDGGKTYTSAVTIYAIPVTSVSVSPISSTIVVNATKQLTATVAPTNATNKSVIWSSNNTSIASVSSTGLVTGKGAGSATITATTQDGNKTATSSITVNTVAVTGVSINPTSATINVNATKQLTAIFIPSNATNKNVTWASSNVMVATISSTGVVTGKAVGSSTITVTTQDGSKTATAIITVIVPVTGVTVSPVSSTISVNGTQQLIATVSPANATNKTVRWSSNNSTVATVNSTGLIAALATGNATISVTTQSGGKIASSTITVTSPWGTPTRYEAENGFNSCSTISSSYGGYSATGYVTSLNASCSETKFDKGVNTVTPTKMDIHYANGTGANVTNLALYIGSNQKIQDLEFTSTGSWSNWGTITVIFNHDPSWGSNICIRSTSNVATSANIDYSELSISTGSRVEETNFIAKDIESIELLSVHPNPANDLLQVTFYSENEYDAIVELMTPLAQVFNRKLHRTIKGSNTVVLDVKELEAGFYLLQLKIGSQKVLRKIIIGN